MCGEERRAKNERQKEKKIFFFVSFKMRKTGVCYSTTDFYFADSDFCLFLIVSSPANSLREGCGCVTSCDRDLFAGKLICSRFGGLGRRVFDPCDCLGVGLWTPIP